MPETIITPKITSYKAVCSKLGFIMCVYFICRAVSDYTMYLILGLVGEIGVTAAYISGSVINIMLLYMLPMLVTAIFFKSFDYYSGKFAKLYKKPKQFARALGNFPAMYGLGQSVNFLTMLVFWVIATVSHKFIGQTNLSEFFRPAAVQPAPNLICAVVMVFVAAIIAPIFEELWVRGLMYDALKPYGHGIAIVVSSILFGLLHGSPQMLFYTTALGFALGYIRYATDSLLVVTILHMMFNAVGAVALFLLFMMGYTGDKIANTLCTLYILAMFVFLIIGIIAFLRKIPLIKKYKVAKIWDEIGAGRKAALFFTSIPALIMLLLAINEHLGNPVLVKIIENTL